MSARRFGFHLSIAGGLQNVPARARRTRCDTIQIFTQSPRRWSGPAPTSDAIAAFRQGIAAQGIDPVTIHTIYPINLASADDGLYEGSIDLVAEDLRRAGLLGVPLVNTHVGHARDLNYDEALDRVTQALREVLRRADSPARLLLENAALRGTFHGSRFEELAALIEGAGGPERLGMCLDTAHAFASGYPVHTEEGLDETLAALDRTVGLENLYLVHLNDSKSEFGSHVDRHEHLGKGKLGHHALRRIVNHPKLRHLPFVMETPIDDRRDDVGNMRYARRLVDKRA
ncbi:MAG TPA: deoxyribonuclease IV [Armatimonadota bacterium]|nr:deoxyribonuclease IV [Armatimonadota bacterium]